jgi:hypothetical protein
VGFWEEKVPLVAKNSKNYLLLKFEARTSRREKKRRGKKRKEEEEKKSRRREEERTTEDKTRREEKVTLLYVTYMCLSFTFVWSPCSWVTNEYSNLRRKGKKNRVKRGGERRRGEENWREEESRKDLDDAPLKFPPLVSRWHLSMASADFQLVQREFVQLPSFTNVYSLAVTESDKRGSTTNKKPKVFVATKDHVYLVHTLYDGSSFLQKTRRTCDVEPLPLGLPSA